MPDQKVLVEAIISALHRDGRPFREAVAMAKYMNPEMAEVIEKFKTYGK